MKKLLFPLSLLTLVVSTVISCRENQDSEMATSKASPNNLANVNNPIVSVPSKKLSYDEVFISKESQLIDKNRQKAFAKIASLNTPFSYQNSLNRSALSNTGSVIQNDQIVVTSPQKTFIGGVFNSKTIDNLDYSSISYPVKPITVSYSFPSDFVVDTIERPSLSSMRLSVFKALRAGNFSGEQSLAFDYSMKEYSYYSELKIAFGSNINVGNLFGIDISGEKNKVKAKTAIFAKFTQKNFTIDMDMPINGNIFLKESDLELAKAQNPIYISSITYGRLGIVSVESNYSYEKVTFALRAAFTAGIVNGSLQIDSESEKILKESNLKTFIVGGRGSDAVKVVEGFSEFSKFIINGGKFTADVPGVPIYFSASHASDNSVYFTTYTTNQ
ncbi:TPA: thiol-activated cytolysin family protein [Elizabethkingia anophelis]